MARCDAITAKGARCRRAATAGATACSVHLGARRPGESVLTDEVRDRLADLLRAGNYVDVACAAAGVARRSFYVWLKRGAEDEQPYAAFRAVIETARAEGEATLVTRIAASARSDWRAAAWILERHAPERWERPSQRRRIDDAPDATDLTAPDPFDQLDELAPRREARGGGTSDE